MVVQITVDQQTLLGNIWEITYAYRRCWCRCECPLSELPDIQGLTLNGRFGAVIRHPGWMLGILPLNGKNTPRSPSSREGRQCNSERSRPATCTHTFGQKATFPYKKRRPTNERRLPLRNINQLSRFLTGDTYQAEKARAKQPDSGGNGNGCYRQARVIQVNSASICS